VKLRATRVSLAAPGAPPTTRQCAKVATGSTSTPTPTSRPAPPPRVKPAAGACDSEQRQQRPWGPGCSARPDVPPSMLRRLWPCRSPPARSGAPQWIRGPSPGPRRRSGSAPSARPTARARRGQGRRLGPAAAAGGKRGGHCLRRCDCQSLTSQCAPERARRAARP